MRYAKQILAYGLFLIFSTAAFAVEKCQVNEQGVALVKHYEGFFPKAYIDGGSGLWAIGYGTQGPKYKIGPNTTWTEEKADKVLRKDLQEVADILCREITAPITSNQLAALASLAYNVGPYTVLKSRLFAKVNSLEPKEAAKRFMLYTKAGGVELRGLVYRRKLEQILFLTPDFVHLDIKATADDIYQGRRSVKQ